MRSNFIIFPNDTQQNPNLPLTYSTLYRPFGTPSSDDLDAQGVLRKSARFLGGLYARIAKWQLDVSFSLASGASDSVGVTLDAVKTGDVLLTDERELPLHQGWYGTGTSTNGDAIAVRFGEAVHTDGLHYTLMGATQIPFALDYLSTEDFASIAWGRSEGDDCPITATLPETGGSFLETPSGFDENGFTEFLLQWGGRIGVGGTDNITGTGTLNPYRYWEYRDAGGLHPIYDQDSGEWLLNPNDRKNWRLR